MIYACTFISILCNVNMLSFYFCDQEYKIAMVNTRNKDSSTRLIPTRKNNATSCSQKDLPDNLWCNNCRNASNMGHRTKAKSCLKPWLINLNDFSRNQTKHYYSIKTYKEKRLSNCIDTPKKEVTDESKDPMNILKAVSPNIKRSYSWQGITEATGE